MLSSSKVEATTAKKPSLVSLHTAAAHTTMVPVKEGLVQLKDDLIEFE